MTEAEWMAYTDPTLMLEFLREKASDRKLRLFAVACCRRVRENMTDERSRQAVDVAEGFADSLASQQECRKAFSTAGAAAKDALISNVPPQCLDRSGASVLRVEGLAEISLPEAAANAAQCAAYPAGSPSTAAARLALSITPSYAADVVYARHGFSDTAKREEQKEQCHLIRDIFGNPFRTIVFSPALRTLEAVGLAQAIYQDRAFNRLPILADALEEAGCQEQSILDHLRSPGPHVRGCWPLDLILGRA